MNQLAVSNIISKQRSFFYSGRTKDISFRLQQLRTLKRAIQENEEVILEAVKHDLSQPALEAYVGEIGLTLNDIDYAIRNLKSWTKPIKVHTPLVHFPASSYVYSEPLGVVLIIGTWNYPFQFTLHPLVGAIAAGNCSILKPSEISISSSGTIAKIIGDNFDPDFISVIEGEAETTQTLLAEKFDHIIYTGGTRVGKIVMEAAAKQLTPVTLELGGKNPCIVDRDVHIEVAARRIAWGKFVNAGQTCIAPDYLLLDEAIKRKLLESLVKYIREFYGDDPSRSPDYARVINEKHFDRLSRLLKEGDIITGGDVNREDLYISPTVIDNISVNDKIMEEEIFGPILPVIEYEDLTEAISIVNQLPKSLALYFFSKNRENQERVLRGTSSGGGCINDTLAHVMTTSLPLGPVGDSGMGQYHGKASFDTFSHKRSILKKSLRLDMKIRYPPYNKEKLRLLRWFF